jgi:predicted amidohydrolase
MLVGCVQFAPEPGRAARNVEVAAEMIRGAAGADLLVLPELVTTGYLFEDRAEAMARSEPVPEGPSIRAFAAIARDAGCSLCFGIAERSGDRVMNSAVLLSPAGFLLVYRKVHLFLDEKDWFDPGDLGFPVADLPGGARAGILVCFDWAFPEAARALALRGADLLLHPANLVLPYGQKAMAVRALENGVFALTANRTGEEVGPGRAPLRFSGGSQVVSPRGEVLAALGANAGLLLAEVDQARARDKYLTPRNHLLEDRRPDHYKG